MRVESRNDHRLKMIKIIFVLLFSFLFKQASPQSIVHRMYLFNPGLTFTAGVGPTVSFTDVKKNSVFPSRKPVNEIGGTIQGTLSWDVFQFLRIGGQLAYATISGSKPNGNLEFSARLIEGNFSISLNPVLLFIPYRSDQKLSPYVIVGIGLSYYSSDLVQISDGKILATRGYGAGSGFWGLVIEGVALGGVGVSYKINENWFIRLESANRWMDSDRLDSFESANRSPYDFYNLTTIGVSYKLFKPRTYPMIRK